MPDKKDAIREANPKTVRQLLLDKFYEVPDFQREFVWKAQRQVLRLLEDLKSAFDARAEEGDYFLGSIVFWEENGVRWLVDGQQRMTTLYIFVSAIRDRMNLLVEDQPVGKYEAGLKGVNAEADSDDPTYKVKLQSDDVSTLLRKIADGEGATLTPGVGGTRYRIVHAYRRSIAFLEENIGDDAELLDSFFEYMWRQAGMIAIETIDLQSAYRIFQTLNDRGATLLASDLLKSLLFRTAANDKSAQKVVAAEWARILNAMERAGETNHVRFLRYFIMAEYDTSGPLRADSLFGWLTSKTNEVIAADLKKPAPFASKIRQAAEEYAEFSFGRDTAARRLVPLDAIRRQGSGIKQHLCLLLAGRKLKREAFDTLAEALETLTMSFILAREQWNVLEKALPDWTKEIRAAQKAPDQSKAIADFVAKKVRPLIHERAARMWERLDDTEPDPKKLLECILARLAFFVQKEAKLPGNWETLFEPETTLEHILPQGLKQQNLDEFGVHDQEEGRRYVYRLGNLALMPWGKNSSMSDRTWALIPGDAPSDYQPKKPAFKNSDWLLFSSLGDDKRYGKKVAANLVIEKYGLYEAEEWNVKQFTERQATLETIASDVWPLLPSRPEPETES